MTTTKTAKTLTTIQQAAFNRGTVKETGEVFYTVRSDSDANVWYTLRWDNEQHKWVCSCPATSHNCKHVRCLNEHLAARQSLLNEQAAAVAEAQMIVTEKTATAPTIIEPSEEIKAAVAAKQPVHVADKTLVPCAACHMYMIEKEAQHLDGKTYCGPCCHAEIARRHETATFANRGFQGLLKR